MKTFVAISQGIRYACPIEMPRRQRNYVAWTLVNLLNRR